MYNSCRLHLLRPSREKKKKSINHFLVHVLPKCNLSFRIRGPPLISRAFNSLCVCVCVSHSPPVPHSPPPLGVGHAAEEPPKWSSRGCGGVGDRGQLVSPPYLRPPGAGSVTVTAPGGGGPRRCRGPPPPGFRLWSPGCPAFLEGEGGREIAVPGAAAGEGGFGDGFAPGTGERGGRQAVWGGLSLPAAHGCRFPRRPPAPSAAAPGAADAGEGTGEGWGSGGRLSKGAQCRENGGCRGGGTHRHTPHPPTYRRAEAVPPPGRSAPLPPLGGARRPRVRPLAEGAGPGGAGRGRTR